jgi:hypothetical protein
MKLLTKVPLAWSPVVALRLWVLVITCFVSTGEDRAWLVNEIIIAMEELGFNTWNEALSTLKEIIWVEEILDTEARNLGLEIQKATSLIYS